MELKILHRASLFWDLGNTYFLSRVLQYGFATSEKGYFQESTIFLILNFNQILFHVKIKEDMKYSEVLKRCYTFICFLFKLLVSVLYFSRRFFSEYSWLFFISIYPDATYCLLLCCLFGIILSFSSPRWWEKARLPIKDDGASRSTRASKLIGPNTCRNLGIVLKGHRGPGKQTACEG